MSSDSSTTSPSFKSNEELELFIRQFELGILPRPRWNHAAHLAVAAWYCCRYYGIVWITRASNERPRMVRRRVARYLGKAPANDIYFHPRNIHERSSAGRRNIAMYKSWSLRNSSRASAKLRAQLASVSRSGKGWGTISGSLACNASTNLLPIG